MDGVLVVDKPSGPTSHDVVARVRRATLRPGITEIDVEPLERYRFQGRDFRLTDVHGNVVKKLLA